MKRFTLFCLFAAYALAQAPAAGIQSAITVPDKAVAAINQTLDGTWLLELRRPGALPASTPTLNLISFQPNGTAMASAGDGTQSSGHGLWVRVGDRRFIGTMIVMNFDATRALTSLTKARINVLVSTDGKTMKGTTEIVVMDRDGKVMATIPGGTYTGVRLSAEISADFYNFQSVE